jgi:hypothetical protein
MRHIRSSGLALEVAQILDDMKFLALHEKFVRDFPESIIREKLAITLSYPEEEIKISRAAIYTSLMNAAYYGRHSRR